VSNDTIMEEMRQTVEAKIIFLRSNGTYGQTGWINAHGAADPRPSNYDILHAYLLFQILDMLDSIDSRLIATEDAMEQKQ